LGYFEAHYLRDEQKSDIREILADEVRKYFTRFFLAFLIWIPIMVLAWIVPYVKLEFLTDIAVIKGNTLYVFLMFILSTIIQFGLGYPFYIGSFKSVR
jgi:hypothetical protein